MLENQHPRDAHTENVTYDHTARIQHRSRGCHNRRLVWHRRGNRSRSDRQRFSRGAAGAPDRRHLIEWTTSLRLLGAEEFEWLVGELFRRDGWTVEETGRHGSPDGNIDLVLRRGGERKVVQCKRWTSQLVGVDELRGFAGTLLREGLPGAAGIFVTLSDFTEQARAEARTTGITLVNNRDLKRPHPKCAARGTVLDLSGCDGA